MSMIQFASDKVELKSSPIHKDWILEGNPTAKSTILSHSSDKGCYHLIWECTAGRFNWFYEQDEWIFILDGAAVITNEDGVARRVTPGDAVYFPAGAKAHWHIEEYVRKVAMLRNPIPAAFVFVGRVMHKLKSLLLPSPKANGASALLGAGSQ